jgi:hypothetical protein
MPYSPVLAIHICIGPFELIEEVLIKGHATYFTSLEAEPYSGSKQRRGT